MGKNPDDPSESADGSSLEDRQVYNAAGVHLRSVSSDLLLSGKCEQPIYHGLIPRYSILQVACPGLNPGKLTLTTDQILEVFYISTPVQPTPPTFPYKILKVFDQC